MLENLNTAGTQRTAAWPSLLGFLAAAFLSVTPLAAQDLSGTYFIQVKANGLIWHEDGGTDRLVSTRYQPDDDFVRFILERQPDDSYRIRVKANDRYLHNDGCCDELISTRYQPNDDFTRFFFERQPDDSYRIRVKATDKYLHDDGGGDHLVSTRYQPNDDFTRFYLIPENARVELDGTYQIQVKANGLLWHEDGCCDQLISTRYQPDDDFTRFIFEKQPDNSYRIKVKANGRYLHHDGLGDDLMSTRHQVDDDFTRFFFEPQSDGSYRVWVKANGEYLHNDGLGDHLISTRYQPDDDFTRFFLIPQAADNACVPDDTTLCIDDQPGDRRFKVRLHFDSVLAGGIEGDALTMPLASLGITKGGIIAFRDATNPEVLVKILNACALNGHYWVFFAATTTVGFDLTVEDTVAGIQKTYTNPDQTAAETITDTHAFETCQ